ncbi:MAG: glycosyltransferase family 2 protein [Rickettsiaceae bacterium]|nr:MAG: glycosyltransferase family 2 protein [Rickettsiaceae bacterium]
MASQVLPAFSIIIPVYNGQHVIERCIQSILKQTHEVFELIIIDDGSTDQTGRVCQEYHSQDKRIKYFKQVNGGVSSARNQGLDTAQNEYLLFVDADDYLLPNFLSNLSSSLIKNKLDSKTFIFQDFIADITSATGKKESFKWCKFDYGQYDLAGAFEALSSINWLNWGVPFAKVYRNSIIKSNAIRFNEKMTFREDLVFMLEYIAYVDIFIFDPTANYCYIIDNTKKSLSSTTASFTSEVIFFEYSKQITNLYIEKFKLKENIKSILRRMVYGSFFRCINSCMYKHKTPMRMQDRIKNIKLIATDENLYFLKKSGIIDTKTKHFAFFLLSNKLYSLYDIANRLRTT